MSMKKAVNGIGQHANMLPRERGFSLPCVRVEGDKITIYRFFYLTRASAKDGTMISAPTYVGIYDWSGDKFVALRAVTVKPEGLPPPPWKHSRPTFDSPSEIIPEFERIWGLYDLLIPAFASGGSDHSAATIAAAKEYLRAFDRHAERPLMAYYRHYGGHFLDWVKQVAAQ
jgi:hypothetical protein